jgi:hypothetical protein
MTDGGGTRLPGDETPLEPGDGSGEGHARRRALLILIAVVVVAAVVALIAWSITTADSPDPSVTSSATTPAEGSDSSDAPSATPEPEESGAAGGDVTDDILGFDEEAPVGDGVTVALSDLEPVEGEASTPGEVAGPSLRFTVTFTNDGDEAYSLVGAVTNLYFGAEQIPATELAEPGGEAFPAEVAPGGTASGTFVYNVPTEQRGQVRITVDYAAAEPAVVYEGSAPE